VYLHLVSTGLQGIIAGAFIAPLPTEKSNILIVKSSLRHWQQPPNLFIAPLPTTAVCAIGN
jgi:hypothetical protein